MKIGRNIWKIVSGVIISIAATALTGALVSLLTKSSSLFTNSSDTKVDCYIPGIGNGFCDIVNNNLDCNFDGDDCQCTIASDCPNGGKNYRCKDNVCECPSNLIEFDDNCVGMLPFNKNNLQYPLFI